MKQASPGDLSDFIARETEQLRARAPSLPFDRAEYAERLRRIRRTMARDGVDVLVLTAPDSMCWLHGYASRWYRIQASTTLPPIQCTVVHLDEDPMFMIETCFHEELVRLTSCVGDFRGIPATGLDHEASVEDYVAFLVGQLRLQGWTGGVVGLEAWSCLPNPAVFKATEEALTEAGCRVVDATRTIRSVRRLKSPAEIAMIERAQAACDAGLLALQREVKPGMTELEAWNVYMTAQIAAGGEPAAIHETVAVGPPEPMLHMRERPAAGSSGATTSTPTPAAPWSTTTLAALGPTSWAILRPPSSPRSAGSWRGPSTSSLETARVGVPFREVNARLAEYYRGAGAPDGEFFMGGYELGVSFPPDWVGEFCWGTGYDGRTRWSRPAW